MAFSSFRIGASLICRRGILLRYFAWTTFPGHMPKAERVLDDFVVSKTCGWTSLRVPFSGPHWYQFPAKGAGSVPHWYQFPASSAVDGWWLLRRTSCRISRLTGGARRRAAVP